MHRCWMLAQNVGTEELTVRDLGEVAHCHPIDSDGVAGGRIGLRWRQGCSDQAWEPLKRGEA